MFTHEEITQIEAHGLSVAAVERQIENFRNGFPALPVVRAAAGGDGVKQLDAESVKERETYYNDNIKNRQPHPPLPRKNGSKKSFPSQAENWKIIIFTYKQ